MFREITASLFRLTGQLPAGIATRRPARLNVDELSGHMLRDLGLADGHARPLEKADVPEPDPASRQERLILTPFAS